MLTDTERQLIEKVKEKVAHVRRKPSMQNQYDNAARILANSVPALLAIIERLEEVASEAESRVHYCPVCKEHCKQCECWEKRIGELESQNAELRQQLELQERDMSDIDPNSQVRN